MLIDKKHYSLWEFSQKQDMLGISVRQTRTGVLLNNLIIQLTNAVVDIMENLFFLVVAAILLAVSVYFLISYLKDRKKTKLTFNKRKW